VKAITFNAFTPRMMGCISISFALIAAFVVHPMASHAHGKGIYPSKAVAQQRASVIGCNTVHQNNGKWMPCADERELHRQLRKL
jgi:hypothetical protein